MAKPLAVLLVEDSESDTELVVRQLRKAGYKVDHERVETAEGMRAALEKQAWDIVISDYSLPQFNGPAALALLKETGGDIPFIVVSGTIGEETAVTMMKAGAFDYLMKSNLVRLVPAIERELEQAVVRREHRKAQEKIRDSEKRFRALIENNSDAITLLDAKGKVLYDSPSAPGLLGYGPIDWVGKDAFKLMHPGDLQKNQEIFRDLQKTPGKRANTIFRVMHKSGSWSWIEATATNLLEEPTVNAIVLNYRDITGRKQAEEALRENESILRGFLQQSEDAIMLTDEQGAVIQWSRGAERLTGYSGDESLGKPLWDVQFRSASDEIKSPENYERLKAILQKALRTGRGTFLNHLVEAEIHRPNDTRAATQTMAFSIQTHKGFLLGSILRDISGRKRREEQLVESESRYKGLFEDSPIALWEEDFSAVKQRLDALRKEDVTNFREYFTSHPQTVAECAALVKVLDVNKAAIKLLGANEKGDLFKGLADLLKDEPNQEFQKELINIAEGKTSFGWEGSNRTLDGRLINIDLRWSAVPGYENTLSRVLVSMMDITERTQTEAALARSEKDYRTLFENMPIGLYRTSADGRILDANEAMVKMFGYPDREALLAKNVVEFYLDPASDLKFKSEIEKTGVVSNFEAEFKRPDGTTFWTEDHNRVIRDENGKPLFYEGSMIDITERKQAKDMVAAERDLMNTLINTLPDSIFIKDVMGRIVVDNNAHRRTLGADTLEQVVGKTDFDFFPKEQATLYDADEKQVIRSGEPLIDKVTPFTYKDQSQRWLRTSKVPLRDSKGNITGIVGFNHDITERKQADEKLAEEQNLLRTLVDNLPDNIFIKDVMGRIVIDNNPHRRTLGAETLEQVVGKTDFDFFPRELAVQYDADEKQILQSGEPLVDMVEPVIDKANKQRKWLLTTKVPLRDSQGIVTGLVGISRDITERKQAEEELLAERNLLTTLIDTLPNNIFIKDVMGRIVMNNTSHRRTLGANTLEQVVGKTDFDFFPAELASQYDADDKQVVRSGQPLIDKIEPVLDKENNQRWLQTTKVPLRDRQGNITGIVGFNHDITDRKGAEEILAEERNLLRTLVDNLPDRIMAMDTQGRKTLSNLADWQASGRKTMDDVIGKTDFDTYPPELATQFWAINKAVLDTGTPVINHEEGGLDADGNPVWVLSTKVPLRDGQGNVVGLVGIGRDITERKQADEMLMAERDLLTTLIDTLPDSIFIKDVMGRIVLDNDAHRRTLGANTLEQVVGKTDFDFHPREQAAQYDADEKQVIRSGEPLIDKVEALIDKDRNQRRWLLTTKVPLRDRQGNFTGIVGFNHDITERKQADERIRQQLEHLAALRAIDQVIISSFDLRNSLTEILKHVTKELGVDAADVLTLSSGYQALEFSAGVGFRTRAAERASVRMGQNHAGRVALERQLIHIPNLMDQPDEGVLKTVLAGEDFVCYYGVPLIAKGSVKGVLEVYHRSPLEPDREWLEFLNTLADQAALAIDNAHLFENLQRSNIDLTLAYDATIEGWSRAMDLRDKETEGHTLRVTEMTMELATLFGINDESMVGIRRGALLHDIGKMGVPDAILLKPSTLTDEEWVIMRRHPVLAFEMLSPIHYLQSAIDIPYCHHEKWDGTGYPRGLKGEQIPLAARIFALADVWDALTSDRPYRNAWPNDKVLEYLKSEAGKHFDPDVVKICLDAGVFIHKKKELAGNPIK